MLYCLQCWQGARRQRQTAAVEAAGGRLHLAQQLLVGRLSHVAQHILAGCRAPQPLQARLKARGRRRGLLQQGADFRLPTGPRTAAHAGGCLYPYALVPARYRLHTAYPDSACATAAAHSSPPFLQVGKLQGRRAQACPLLYAASARCQALASSVSKNDTESSNNPLAMVRSSAPGAKPRTALHPGSKSPPSSPSSSNVK